MLCIKIGTMKTIWQLILIGSATIFFQCSSSNTASIQVAESEEKHELIVMDSGFNSWLATQPSIEMYSHAYLKTKNVTFVAEYNSRVNNRQYYGNDLYPQRIEYPQRKSMIRSWIIRCIITLCISKKNIIKDYKNT